MSESYRKEGLTRRFELAEGEICRIDLIERGESFEREGRFTCRSLPGIPEGLSEPESLSTDLIDLLLGLGDACERATVTVGTSRHHFSGPKDRRVWEDSAVRLHVSIVNRRRGLRFDFERGAATFDHRWLHELKEIATAAASAIGPPQKEDVLLEPAVSAAAVATLAAHGMFEAGGGLIQRPRSRERDGKGLELSEAPPTSLPELGWFRPSYRVPPRRAPHGIDFANDPAPDAERLPALRAIALMGPPRVARRTLTLVCLIVPELSAEDARIGTVEIDVDRWNPSSAEERRIWFPFAAGVWGRRLIVAAQ